MWPFNLMSGQVQVLYFLVEITITGLRISNLDRGDTKTHEAPSTNISRATIKIVQCLTNFGIILQTAAHCIAL